MLLSVLLFVTLVLLGIVIFHMGEILWLLSREFRNRRRRRGPDLDNKAEKE